MKPASFFQKLQLTWWAQPAHERTLYRAILARQPRAIVEIGMGDATRCQRMLSLALRFHAPAELRYTAIDQFEARPTGEPRLALKEAHRLLAGHGIQVKLAPGDPFSALARAANTLLGTDLLLVSRNQDPNSLREAWFYVPRMLHQQSLVLVEDAAGTAFQALTEADVTRLAAACQPRRRAA